MARRSRKQPPPQLYELEAEIMEDVWRRQEASDGDLEVSVRDVLEALNLGSKKRAYTTVMTVMIRLDDKGLLKRRRRGRADVYRVAVSREQYRRERARVEVGALLDQYGDLAIAQFASQAGPLDADRLRQLRAMASDE
jgi:predicted transcriptional regulator